MAPLTQDVADALHEQGTPWKVPMMETATTAPSKFAYGCCCPVCFAYSQRKEILEVTGEDYICCGGMYPCGMLGEPCNENLLFVEVCCCTGCAVGGNRWMLQSRFLKQNDACDDCIICCNAALACMACILQVAGADDDLVDAVHCISELLNCAVTGCMLTQHQIEIESIKEGNVQVDVQKILSKLPPKQQEMIKVR
mmetsp:Transcript_32536/g.87271  ORF Transcript_32536/g.87271 Transcript_32536/m.87271 type:complete len:196 (-) Transcript_32536:66-653(-)